MPYGTSAAPLILGTQITITRGQLKQFPAQPLAPSVLVPYEVNAIRMSAFPSINGGGDCASRGFLKWQFIMGRLPLTDNYVPTWNLCPNRQIVTELGGYYEWRFKRPMLIPPGGRIDARVQLQANTPNVGPSPTITVAVAFAGQLRGDLTSLPPYIDVPFASCWDTTVTGAVPQNDPLTLRNPLDGRIQIESIVGRIQNDNSGNDGDATADGQLLQIFDPRGVAIHPNGQIQFHTLFPEDTREFPYTGILPYNTHFTVRLGTPPSATDRPMISYLGSRRERAR
jgi:hypothetical protein